MRRCSAFRAVLSIAVGAGLAMASNAGATDFSDRDLLIEDFSLDEQEPLADAQAELAVAEAELATAQGAFDAAVVVANDAAADLAAANEALEEAQAAIPPDPTAVAEAEELVAEAEADLAAANASLAAAEAALAASQEVFDAKLAAVQAIEAELALTAELVGELSEKQVHDLNAALQSARKTGLLPLDLDAAHLQAILDGAYGTREIHALVQAYESEARFDRIALRFLERYEDTAREHFADQAERFADRGDAHKERFLAKIDRFEAQEARHEVQAALREAREAAREAAREERGNPGRHLAKGHGH